MSILSSITRPSDLRQLGKQQLSQLAEEIRKTIIEVVAANGGHLAPNLGVVELTLALHRVLNAPEDKIIWDVGHQCYAHKLLTGRWERFGTLRQLGGISGFPKVMESPYDEFGVGHSSTSISAALGLALARDFQNRDYVVAAVIGDGALTGGMAFEALNHAGHLGTNLLVIVNDNEMSISPNVGALSQYLTRIRLDPTLSRARNDVEQLLKRIPAIGGSVVKLAERITDTLKTVLVPGRLFQELGFTYYGPIDGHDISGMQLVFKEAIHRKGPVLVHVITQKGKGWQPAEENPEKFHSVSPFSLDKVLKEHKLSRRNLVAVSPKSKASCDGRLMTTYGELLGTALVEMGRRDEKLVAITAAMPEGTGLARFGDVFPHRMFDVGIAEEHAVTLAAGLAKGGMRPVFAVYSTFLQRAVDQVIHDVCLQNLPVVLAVDRAGLVGEDGPTHHGVFDLSLLQPIPNLTLLAPKDGREMVRMLAWAVHSPGPVAIRYPKETLPEPLALTDIRQILDAETSGEQRAADEFSPEVVRLGSDGVIVAVGTMVSTAQEAAQLLHSSLGLSLQVVNLRRVKPLDVSTLIELTVGYDTLITLEENALTGGVGARIIQLLAQEGVLPKLVVNLGIPDEFVTHGARRQLLSTLGLTAEGVAQTLARKLANPQLVASALWTGESSGS